MQLVANPRACLGCHCCCNVVLSTTVGLAGRNSVSYPEYILAVLYACHTPLMNTVIKGAFFFVGNVLLT